MPTRYVAVFAGSFAEFRYAMHHDYPDGTWHQRNTYTHKDTVYMYIDTPRQLHGIPWDDAITLGTFANRPDRHRLRDELRARLRRQEP